jgi:hypothetical protein
MKIIKQLFHRARFQNVYKTYNVAVDVSVGVFQTVTHPGLCSEVADFVEFYLLEQLVELFAVFEVHAHKAVVWVLCALYFLVPVFGFAAYAGFGEAGVFQVYPVKYYPSGFHRVNIVVVVYPVK